MQMLFRYQNLPETRKGSPTIFFSAVRQKIINRKFWSLFFIRKFFRYPNFFWNTEVFAHEIFWYCETKNYQQKLVKSPHCPYVFSITDFSETQKGSLTTFFGFVRQIIWQKIVIHTPLLLSIKTFDTRSFLKHRRILLRSFLIPWDKKFDKNLWNNPFSDIP